MPELPEVETIVKHIRPGIEGATIEKVVKASPLMARCTWGPFSRGLKGKTVKRLDRQGKWIFFRLGDGNTLVIHLGMTGRLGIADSSDRIVKHTHMRLRLNAGDQELRFSDSRRFGELLLVTPVEYDQRFGPGRLGPDALSVRTRHLVNAFSKTRRSLKTVLLDQRVLAGVGNIYADEILFAARLTPTTPACDLEQDEIKQLQRTIGKVLRKSLRHNGTTLRDYVTAQGVPGDFQTFLSVYGRAGEACKRCAAPIELDRAILTGRATYWCPVCQA